MRPAEQPAWRRMWLAAVVATTLGVGIVFGIVVVFGELDAVWVVSLALTVVVLAAFAAARERLRVYVWKRNRK